MAPQQVIPRDARLISLLIASNPSIADAQPQVLHQLLEFAHRYTAQVLGDAQVYAEHAGRTGNIQSEDVTFAIQARAGWDFGGRVPKEYLTSLADRTNSVPLPSIPETNGVRLPPAKHCLTAVDFDLVPNRPPPGTDYYYDEAEAQNGMNGRTDVWGSLADGDEMDVGGEDDGAADEEAAGDATMDDSGLFGEGDEDLGAEDDEDQEPAAAENENENENDPFSGLQVMPNGFGGMVSMGMDGPGDDAAEYRGEKRKLVEDEDYDF